MLLDIRTMAFWGSKSSKFEYMDWSSIGCDWFVCHVGWELGNGKSTNTSLEVEDCMLWCVRVGKLSLFSCVLLLSLGLLPCRHRRCLTFSHSHDSAVWRVLTTSSVGNATSVQILKCFGTMSHRVARDFAHTIAFACPMKMKPLSVFGMSTTNSM